MVRNGETRLLTMRGYAFVSAEEFSGCFRRVMRTALHHDGEQRQTGSCSKT